ncbi:SDR family oxidoreductase [soil metagenome]
MSARAPRVVVVTGATSGVGRATARLFASEGSHVGLIARSEDALAATAEELRADGASVWAVSADVSDPEDVEAAAIQIEEELGTIDVWINNAMTTVFSFAFDIQPDEFRRATEVTYLGTVWGTQTALRRMLVRDQGTIVQVGSALAYRGIPLQSAYCGAKHAMKGYTESVRSELLHLGSRVHLGMVQLPAVNTPQFSHCRSRFDRHPQPVPPTYTPELAAEAVRLAVTHRRREVYLGFPTFKTIIGNKVAPGIVGRYLGVSGVDSQLSELPPDPGNTAGNLFAPLPGDPGAAGIFGDEARQSSPLLWVSRHRGRLAAGAALLATLGASVSRRAARRYG